MHVATHVASQKGRRHREFEARVGYVGPWPSTPMEVRSRQCKKTCVYLGKNGAQRYILTWPMAKRLKLFGITYLVGKIKFKLFFSGSIG